jgi:hypothetical protein
MGFRFSHHETTVEIEIVELGNTSYSSLWFLQILLFYFYLGKIILGFEILIVKYMIYIFEIMEY